MDTMTRSSVKSRLDANLRAKEGFGDVQIRVEAVDAAGSSAFVTICGYDTLVIFDVSNPANPDDDIIFNDNKDSYRVRWELRQLDGRWLLYEGTNIAQLSGGDLCNF